MTAGRVLLIDDDAAFRFAMRKALRRLGYDVDEAPNGERALEALHATSPPEVALLDLKMTGINGLEVMQRLRQRRTRVIVLTGHGTVRAAVDAMKLGAFSFLEKPVDAEMLAPLLDSAVRDGRHTTDPSATTAPPLIGSSPLMCEIRTFIARVGPTDETVAIYGETGSGKEVVAHHLHLKSKRAAGPFVALNSACVPENLVESELFGHKRGAFTGATADRVGLFEEAQGGTLFIDEIAELPLESQAKLLRALETRTIRAVGSTKTFAVDVRFIAATNCDLWSQVQCGLFREDLFFRLQVFPVVIPPLRDRPEDIVELAEHLLERVVTHPPVLSTTACRALVAYHWPGNVRELLNVLRRVALFTEGTEIDGDLVKRMIASSIFAGSPSMPPEPARASTSPSQSLANIERAHIEGVLDANGGNVTKTAIALGIDRRTLQRKLRSYGLG